MEIKTDKFHIVGLSDVGRKRTNNEDNFELGEEYAVLCDGMGGHTRGEVASQIIATKLFDYFEANKKKDIKDFEVGELIKNGFAYAKQEFIRLEDKLQSFGMGTTLTGVFFWDSDNELISRATVFNLGDSRAYLFNNLGQTPCLKLLTEDHNSAFELMTHWHGKYIEEIYRQLPYKNQLTRCVDSTSTDTPDIHTIEIVKGERILLCSDGLQELTDEEIKNILANNDIKTAAEKLIEETLNKDANDNVTVIVVEKL